MLELERIILEMLSRHNNPIDKKEPYTIKFSGGGFIIDCTICCTDINIPMENKCGRKQDKFVLSLSSIEQYCVAKEFKMLKS